MSGSSASKSSTSSNALAAPPAQAASTAAPPQPYAFSLDLHSLLGGSGGPGGGGGGTRGDDGASDSNMGAAARVHDAILDLLLQDSSKYADHAGEESGAHAYNGGRSSGRRTGYRRGASVEPDSARGKSRDLLSPVPANLGQARFVCVCVCVLCSQALSLYL